MSQRHAGPEQPSSGKSSPSVKLLTHQPRGLAPAKLSSWALAPDAAVLRYSLVFLLWFSPTIKTREPGSKQNLAFRPWCEDLGSGLHTLRTVPRRRRPLPPTPAWSPGPCPAPVTPSRSMRGTSCASRAQHPAGSAHGSHVLLPAALCPSSWNITGAGCTPPESSPCPTPRDPAVGV